MSRYLPPVSITLDDEPFGSCVAHRLVLRTYLEACETRYCRVVECTVVEVGCPDGCVTGTSHDVRA